MPISQVYIGLQVLYVIMMYISVYPVVITMRHSNIYEERSLGIYRDDEFTSFDFDSEAAAPLVSNSTSHSPTNGPPNPNTLMTSTSALPLTLVRRLSRSGLATDIGGAFKRTFTTWDGVGVPPMKRSDRRDRSPASRRPDSSSNLESRISFINQQIHGQLAHDIWWLVLAVLIITTIETPHFIDDPVTFSVFNIIFEVVSAYGTVGISIGVPTDSYSFSGAWQAGSKVVLCLVMLRGRHRGLPVALDHAVRLPGEQLHRDEEEDHRIRRTMSVRRMSLDA